LPGSDSFPRVVVSRALPRLASLAGSPLLLPVCITLAIVMRLAWILVTTPAPVSDHEWYYSRAVGLAAGLGYQIDGAPTAFFPVGYPAFLALLFLAAGPSIFAGQLANVVLYAGVIWLTYALANVLFKSRFVAGTSAGLLTLYPNHVAQAAILSTEALFLFLSLLGIWLLLKPDRRFILAPLAGAVFGLACLVKPQAVMLPCVVLGAHRLSDALFPSSAHLAKVLLCVYAVLCLGLAPWLVRDYRVFSGFVFVSTNGGMNLLIGNNPKATGTYMSREALPTPIQEASSAARNEYERDAIERRFALEFLRSDPFHALRLWPRKLWYLYGADGDGFSGTMAGIPPIRDATKTFVWRGAQLNKLYYTGILVAFVCAMSALCVRFAHSWTPPRETVGLAIIAYFTCIYLIYFGDPRFHFPVMPWVMMTVAAFVARVAEPLTGSERSGTPKRFGYG
jgi:hypothetical protein